MVHPKTKSRTRKNNKHNKHTKHTHKKAKGVELSGKNIKLFVGNTQQNSKLVRVYITPTIIYISRDNSRVYWVIKKLKKSQLPKIIFNDKKQSVKVGNNNIVIGKHKDYTDTKYILKPYC